MKAKKRILILIDESEESAKMAKAIAAELAGNNVSVLKASEFKGNDLLPADAFFIGCEKSGPESFEYLADLFKHINLAGHPCGIFSSAQSAAASKKVLKYLDTLIHDSEAISESLTEGTGIKRWVQKVMSRSV